MPGREPTPDAVVRSGRAADSGHDEHEAAKYSSRTTDAPISVLESDIRLTLPARPENVSVVRHVLGAFAEAVGMPRQVSEDIRLAVTEACTNVVRHAYGGAGGKIDVVIRPRGEALEVIVADDGRGVGPSLDTSGPGLGLSLIAALADSLEVERTATAGSRIVMSFLRRPGTEMRLA
jgi:anti-sigma regulatory factor (Ser/Thr protein kinase)